MSNDFKECAWIEYAWINVMRSNEICPLVCGRLGPVLSGITPHFPPVASCEMGTTQPSVCVSGWCEGASFLGVLSLSLDKWRYNSLTWHGKLGDSMWLARDRIIQSFTSNSVDTVCSHVVCMLVPLLHKHTTHTISLYLWRFGDAEHLTRFHLYFPWR
jgi:hypothetical protein